MGLNFGAVTRTGIFPHKRKKEKKKMPNKWRTIDSLVHKIRLHGRRGKGTAESFSREKLRQTPQKEGGEVLCDPGWYVHKPDVQNKRDDNTHTHTHTHMMCVVCFLPLYSGHQVRWTYQPGSHRRKVTQDFSSTFLLRCVPSFFSREGFSHSFPSSTVKSNFVY